MRVEVRQARSPASLQHALDQRDDAPDVVARRELRHHAAVVLVHGDLRMQRVREQAGVRVVHGDAGLVAGGLDAEDAHGGRRKSDLYRGCHADIALGIPWVIFWVTQVTSKPEGLATMPSVRVRENEPFEAALRRFKRTIEKTGLLTELRAREFYEKPTAERKRKKAAAVKRHYKRIRSQQLPPKLF